MIMRKRRIVKGNHDEGMENKPVVPPTGPDCGRRVPGEGCPLRPMGSVSQLCQSDGAFNKPAFAA